AHGGGGQRVVPLGLDLRAELGVGVSGVAVRAAQLRGDVGPQDQAAVPGDAIGDSAGQVGVLRLLTHRVTPSGGAGRVVPARPAGPARWPVQELVPAAACRATHRPARAGWGPPAGRRTGRPSPRWWPPRAAAGGRAGGWG